MWNNETNRTCKKKSFTEKCFNDNDISRVGTRLEIVVVIRKPFSGISKIFSHVYCRLCINATSRNSYVIIVGDRNGNQKLFWNQISNLFLLFRMILVKCTSKVRWTSHKKCSLCRDFLSLSLFSFSHVKYGYAFNTHHVNKIFGEKNSQHKIQFEEKGKRVHRSRYTMRNK